MDWIEKFTNMMFPINRNDSKVDLAVLLKDQNLPNSIFKYREVGKRSIQNLEEDTIWLADPSSFNDPYDCSHAVDFNKVQKANSLDFFNQLLEKQKDKINLSDETLEKLKLAEDPYNELLELIFSQQAPEVVTAFKNVQQKMLEDLSRSGSSLVSTSFKLCSFSECNDSILMWAHYADNHKGFCIEYDLVNSPVNDPRRRSLYPTIYSRKMFDATEHIMKKRDSEDFNSSHLTLGSLVKAEEWNYEKEWRLVFPFGIMDKAQAFKFGVPKMVHLGARISEDDQVKIIEICKRKNIPVQKMKMHHNIFKLESVQLRDAGQNFFKDKP